MSFASSSASPSPIVPLPLCFRQAVLGIILGGVASFTLAGADPFGVVAFRVPQGVDSAQQEAAYDQWKSSARVIIGSSAMTLIPIIVSAGCGVFGHWSLPSSIPAALARMIGVALFLFVVSSFGSRAIDRVLSTGESSDIQTPFAMLAVEALCIALAAPLSSLLTRRRSRGEARAPAETTRHATGSLS